MLVNDVLCSIRQFCWALLKHFSARSRFLTALIVAIDRNLEFAFNLFSFESKTINISIVIVRGCCIFKGERGFIGLPGAPGKTGPPGIEGLPGVVSTFVNVF